MASKWYPLGVESMLENERDWSGAGVKMALITSATSYNSAHDFYDDISAGVVGTPIALTTPNWSVAGTTMKYDAADTGLTWVAVAAGSTIGAVVVYFDTGVPGTSCLLTYNDVTDTPTNGGDITITISASGIGTIDMA